MSAALDRPMSSAALHEREPERLAALRRYGILDTPREQDFDDIAALASEICEAPIAVVNLIADGRQWFKAEVGLGVRETPLESSFCAHAILQEDFLQVADVSRDPRFDCNPLVTGPTSLRFYAGALLRSEEGLPIGTLCVLDTRPRRLTDIQARALERLARQVMSQLELRLALEARTRSEARLRFLDRLAQATQSVTDPTSIMTITARLLGEHLAVAVCAYADMEPDQNGFTIRGDWTAPGAASIVGFYELDGFGAAAAALLRTGRPLVTRDTVTELGPEQASLFLQLGLRATVCMPLVKEGRLTALMAVHSATPRDWSDAELTLIADTTERSWAHIERLHSEAALRESEARFRALVDASAQIVWTTNAQGEVVEDSASWRAYTGQSLDEWLGSGWIEAVHPEARTCAERQWREAVAALRPLKADLRLYHAASGSWRWTSMRAVPLTSTDGVVRGWVGMNADIEDRKNVEAALRASEANFEAIANSVDQMIWSTRPDGYHDYYNRRWYEFTGVPAGSTDGEAWNNMFHPDDRELARATWRHSLSTGEPYHIEYRLRHRSGAYRWVIGRAQCVRDDHGQITRWYGTCTDIHDRKVAETALRDLNDTLERRVAEEVAARTNVEETLRQAQKMEAIGQLTGGVAHDFNNLLTIIRSSTDLLRRADLPDERRRRYVDAISDTVDRASKLTGQLLAFARRQALKPEVFDVAERIRAFADMLRTILGARVQIVTEFACDDCFVKADLAQFETALVNIAVNARDAMEGEGTLTVRLDDLVQLPPIRNHAGGGGPFVAISLTDTGAGIAPQKLSQIFEPFFTTKEVGKGTGLGLSQVYGFAKQSGGDVDVASEVGRGTTFTLYLPKAEAQPSDDARGELDPPMAKQGGGRRVLVVEDNVDVGTFSTQILQDLGYEPTWAASADEALGCFRDGLTFDVVFSDVVMPGMSGIELAQEIRRLYPGLPVILTSGYSHVLAEQGHQGFELLHKPYAAEKLSRVLRQATKPNAREK